ncbi:MAG: hypothetical protein LBL90_03280 [Prevotellaceae bacterium]|jgi:hypothetical protein|nr:hypothetical protein [Prevotellaceae bacterium]
MSIAEARAWFEIQNANRTKSGSLNSFIALWDSAFVSFNENYEVVEVEILEEEQAVCYAEDNYTAYESSGDGSYRASVVRLVVMRNRNTGEMLSFRMTITPSRNYLERYSFSPPENTYLAKTDDFEGMVMFHDLEGNYVNGWVFENGIAVKTVKPLAAGEGAGTKSYSYTCYTEIFYEITFHYIVWYSNGEFSHIQYLGSSITITGEYNICYPDGGGGDGSSGGYAPPAPPDANKPKNPCDQLNNYVGVDTGFCAMMSILQSTTTQHEKEFGLFLKKVPSEQYGHEFVDKGIEGQCEMELFYPDIPIDGFVHTHYDGCESTFTVGDIGIMYQWYKEGLISDIKDFVFSVVTKDGAYVAKVEDVAKFQNFGEKFLNDPISVNFLEGMFGALKITSDNSITENEKNFISLMNIDIGSGIKLYKANTTDFSGWDRLELDSNENVFVDDCEKYKP